MDPAKLLSGWVEACVAEDAAVILQVFRDEPDLAKTKLGMQVSKAAIKKIKGTIWESSFFGKEPSAKEQKELRLIWEKLGEEKPEVDPYKDIEERSKRHVEQSKAERERKWGVGK